MKAASLATIAVLVVAAAMPASARVVDYSGGDAAMAAAANALKITAVAPAPLPIGRTVALTVEPTADHVTLALGMVCSAYKVENPIRQLMTGLVAQWARAAPAEQAEARLHVTSARSYRRCIEAGEMNVRCITKVTIAGMIDTDGQSSPISGEAERDASVGGFCGDLAKGIGVVSREAAIQLLMAATTKMTPMKPVDALTR